jgi:hypothetical protein
VISKSVRYYQVRLTPGNATVYNLKIVYLNEHLLMVTWMTEPFRGQSAIMRRGFDQAYDCAWMAAYLGAQPGDAGPILAYLRDHHQVRAVLSNEFNQETGVYVGPTIN